MPSPAFPGHKPRL